MIKDLLLLQGTMRPAQIISLMELGPPTFSMADHNDHIHVGYSSTSGNLQQLGEILKADQWQRLIQRLGRSRTQRSRASCPTPRCPPRVVVRATSWPRPLANPWRPWWSWFLTRAQPGVNAESRCRVPARRIASAPKRWRISSTAASRAARRCPLEGQLELGATAATAQVADGDPGEG